ncbi:hypothetical protein N0V90_000388 [Kalmusia sp. IMI 367209]|nr:hypothetical protein N0V90_000388 [Kalmusia sp. IMI 367209]
MSAVYSHAYLVIAAASAEADDIGFFTEPHSFSRGVVFHLYMPHSGSLIHPAPLSPTSIGPLGERAWTLQETFLARRCVGFNKGEVAWECGEARKTSEKETTKKGLETLSAGWMCGVSHRLEGVGLREQAHTRLLTQLQDISITYWEWRVLIILNYVRISLSFASNKLPALSALARIIAEASGDEYIAGIWRKDISIGLAWQISRQFNEQMKLLPSLTISQGPSFSWVSVDGLLGYHLPDRTKKDGSPIFGSVRVNLLDYNVILSGLNQYGAVQDGWTKFSAFSTTFELHWDLDEEIYTLTNEAICPPTRLLFYPDTMLYEAHFKGPNDSQKVYIQRATSRDVAEKSFRSDVEGILLINISHK